MSFIKVSFVFHKANDIGHPVRIKLISDEPSLLINVPLKVPNAMYMVKKWEKWLKQQRIYCSIIFRPVYLADHLVRIDNNPKKGWRVQWPK